ncbi:uncharacterized protein L201_000615 [Kwoniella dendrophila CBS 6074]|uniref:J domain-containing protein n=1 Tax=Kwoniella dendrophila CBS 6074 TaxID=1295534 RepID=A0AAX4JLU8_9TREE
MDEVLINQDPYKRITFEQPLHMLNRSQAQRMFAVQATFRDAEWIEPHLIPFWQVHLLCDQKRSFQFELREGYTASGPVQRYFSDIGIAMSAVPRDHWASGMWVPWTIRMSASKLQEIFDSSLQNSIYLPHSSPKQYHTPMAKQIAPFMEKQWDPLSAPKFAFGIPDIKGKENQIIMLQTSMNPNEEEDDVSDEYSVQKMYEAMIPYGIRVYAIPVYRLLYKVGLKNGYAVFDAQSPAEDANTFRVNWPQGGVRQVNDTTFRIMGHYQRRNTDSGELHESEVINASFSKESKLQELISTLFAGMWTKGPITPAAWENERILPEYGDFKEGTAINLLAYSEACIRGFTPSPSSRLSVEPKFPIKRKEQTKKSSLFTTRNSTTSSTKSNTDSFGEAEYNQSQSQSGQTSSINANTATSRKFKGETNTLKRRTMHYAEQAGIRLGNLKKSIGPERLSPEMEFMTKLPTFLPDPKRFYKNLGILQPSKDYLSLDKQDYIDDLISEKRNKASFINHPDRGGKVEIQREINEAFANLESLKLRRKYYADSRSPFRLNR